jgi:hypothetical protein
MNHNAPACKQAHPYYVLNLNVAFDMEPDELREFIASIPYLYYIECEGSIQEHGEYTDLDCMLLWFYHPEVQFAASDYNIRFLVEWLSRYGLELREEWLFVDYDCDEFAPLSCNAPIIEFPEGYSIDCITSNIDNPDNYLRLLRHSYVRNASVFDEYERTRLECCSEEDS